MLTGNFVNGGAADLAYWTSYSDVSVVSGDFVIEPGGFMFQVLENPSVTTYGKYQLKIYYKYTDDQDYSYKEPFGRVYVGLSGTGLNKAYEYYFELSPLYSEETYGAWRVCLVDIEVPFEEDEYVEPGDMAIQVEASSNMTGDLQVSAVILKGYLSEKLGDIRINHINATAATTANITLSGEQTIDGVSVVTGDIVLVKDQTTATENGVYVADTSSWTREDSFSDSEQVATGDTVFVEEGTVNQKKEFVLTTQSPVIGTSNLYFEQNSHRIFYSSSTPAPGDSARQNDLWVVLS